MAWLYQIGDGRWMVFDDLGRPYSERPTRKEGGHALAALRKELREKVNARHKKTKMVMERLDPFEIPCCPLCDMPVEEDQEWEIVYAHGSVCVVHPNCIDCCEVENG